LRKKHNAATTGQLKASIAIIKKETGTLIDLLPTQYQIAFAPLTLAVLSRR